MSHSSPSGPPPARRSPRPPRGRRCPPLDPSRTCSAGADPIARPGPAVPGTGSHGGRGPGRDRPPTPWRGSSKRRPRSSSEGRGHLRTRGPRMLDNSSTSTVLSAKEAVERTASLRTAQPADPVSTRIFATHHAEGLRSAAALLGGRSGLRLANAALDDLARTPALRDPAWARIDALIDLLALENAHVPDSIEAKQVMLISPFDPAVEEICGLLDSLRDAIAIDVNAARAAANDRRPAQVPGSMTERFTDNAGTAENVVALRRRDRHGRRGCGPRRCRSGGPRRRSGPRCLRSTSGATG